MRVSNKYDLKVIGTNIALIRTDKEITQQELADKSNINRVKLSRIERGVHKTLISDVLEDIADALGVELNDIINYKAQYQEHIYPLYNSVPAGSPFKVDPSLADSYIRVPDIIMGKYSGRDVYFVKASGESMNNIIPNGSLMTVLRIDSVNDLKNDDIVIYSYDNEYSVKRIVIKDEFVEFHPDSNIPDFIPRTYGKNDINLQIHGKVVLYTNQI